MGVWYTYLVSSHLSTKGWLLGRLLAILLGLAGACASRSLGLLLVSPKQGVYLSQYLQGNQRYIQHRSKSQQLRCVQVQMFADAHQLPMLQCILIEPYLLAGKGSRVDGDALGGLKAHLRHLHTAEQALQTYVRTVLQLASCTGLSCCTLHEDLLATKPHTSGPYFWRFRNRSSPARRTGGGSGKAVCIRTTEETGKGFRPLLAPMAFIPRRCIREACGVRKQRGGHRPGLVTGGPESMHWPGTSACAFAWALLPCMLVTVMACIGCRLGIECGAESAELCPSPFQKSCWGTCGRPCWLGCLRAQQGQAGCFGLR